MNNIIKNELKKCKFKLPNYSDNTTELIIPAGKMSNDFILEIGKYFLIELDDHILNPPENYALVTNWNHGIIPVSKYIVITLVKEVNDMKCFDGCGFDVEMNCYKSDVYSQLWLPEKSFKVIKEIK